MNYLVMLGSEMFYGTTGVLTVQSGDKLVEFFRIREIYRVLSKGSYLSVDCDIKDNDNIREIKLFKNKPVVKDESVQVAFNIRETSARRKDKSLIIKIEQYELNNTPLLEFEPVKKSLSGYRPEQLEQIKKEINKITIDGVIKITGDFFAGSHHLIITDDYSLIDGLKTSGNLIIGTRGIKLAKNRFSLG